MSMRLPGAVLVVAALLTAGCGGNAADDSKAPDQAAAAATSDFDPCALLTSEEIQAEAGWVPDSSVKKAYGTTGNCTYFGPKSLQQVTVLVGAGLSDMSSARAMADWRAKQYTDMKVTDAIVEPVEDLGVPAIRNEFGLMAIEMAVNSQLVSVTSIGSSFDQVKALASHVLARMK